MTMAAKSRLVFNNPILPIWSTPEQENQLDSLRSTLADCRAELVFVSFFFARQIRCLIVKLEPPLSRRSKKLTLNEFT